MADIANLEGNLSEDSRLGARAHHLQRLFALIDAEHAARLAYQFGCNQTDIARAAAHIQHLHPAGYAGVLLHPPRERVEHLPLHQ